MKAVIEKVLCNPVDGQIVGPYYHLYTVDENCNKTFIKTFDGDITAAAKEAERMVDIDCIETSYSENPELFSSVVSINEDDLTTKLAVEYAEKCYNQFCDELITALENIRNLYYNDILYATGREVNTYYQKWEAYKEIAARIHKERLLQRPNLDTDKFRKIQYDRRIKEDNIIDELIPRGKFYGKKDITLKREEIENIKRKLSIKIEELTNEAFRLGLTINKKDNHEIGN